MEIYTFAQFVPAYSSFHVFVRGPVTWYQGQYYNRPANLVQGAVSLDVLYQ
jgi:hypothetical protein